ncbi:hypothetical protein ACIQVL_48785 [Streptomyces sp. NPDC090499]|uniref:hypothetical protein n=1 Tax=Streptomyces sp. NPDC090499 TaxID=3365965 RepID=UPI0037F563F1
MSDLLPEALADYLIKRDNQRAQRVQEFLTKLTPRERGLVHDAAVMGFFQGLQRDRDDSMPKDAQTVALVIDACFAYEDLYPHVNADLAPHPATSTYTVETPRHEDWGRWSPVMDDTDWARERWQTAIEHSPGRRFRMVRADTVYTVTAEHNPNEET